MQRRIILPTELRPAARLALADELMRTDLATFTRRSFELVVPGERLMFNWHIRAMAFALARVLQGKTKRLIITVPPRYLKSILGSVSFPAFALGHDPTRKFVCVSYSQELSSKHHVDCRTIMHSGWYRRIFPAARISSEKNNESEFLTTQRGGRLATSTAGMLIGRGGSIFILDDLMKPEEAMSDSSRGRILHWFRTTLLTRLNMKAEDAIIVIMQRLHVEDLAGILLEAGGWEHLNLPAIAEEMQDIPVGPGEFHRRMPGDVLHREREPREVLDELKKSMGTMAYSALYEQRPIPLEGNLIKREWLRFYEHSPEEKLGDKIVISWDTAMSASELADYSVGTVWRVRGDQLYLLDRMRGRFDYPELRRAVKNSRQRWLRATILIEDKGSGISLIQELRREGAAIIAIRPEMDKVTRLYTTQPLFESGSVHFPKNEPWLDELVSELLAFPHGPHDDQVDSISQALTWAFNRRRSVPPWNDAFAPVKVLKG